MIRRRYSVMTRRLCGFAMLVCGTALPASAQLSPPNELGVAMGHLHDVVRDVEANTRFWVALGGRVTDAGRPTVIAFPGVRVLLDEGVPAGGTEGSVLNHVAFRVRSLDAVALPRR